MAASAVQESRPTICAHISLSWISFPLRSPGSAECSSLCSTGSSHQLASLYTEGFTNSRERYIQLNAEFQRIATSDKKDFLNDQCKEIEANNRMGLRKHHYKVSGDDGIPVELSQILKDDAVKVLHSICQQFGKLSAGHRSGKSQFSFQSQRSNAKG